jgi:hypothetical protein
MVEKKAPKVKINSKLNPKTNSKINTQPTEKSPEKLSEISPEKSSETPTEPTEKLIENTKIKKLLRTQYVIYPRFQFLLIAVNATLMLVSFAIIFFEASQTFSRFRHLGGVIQLSADHPYFKLIEFESSGMYASLILSFSLAILITSAVTLVISHRLAGPIVRLKSYFSEISKTGSVQSKLKFRDGDYFEDLPEVINSALDGLIKRKGRLDSDSEAERV